MNTTNKANGYQNRQNSARNFVNLLSMKIGAFFEKNAFKKGAGI